MSKRIIALFLSLCLIISAAPAATGAATGQQVIANAVTVTAGNTASVTLRAENFESIAALDVYIFYDPEVFTVSSTYNGSMLSGAQTSVNTGEAGKITLSTMSLNGISGSGNLITVYFTTSADATPGTYPIDVAIGRAYNGSLQPVTVSGVSGSVTLSKPVATQTFYIYNYLDNYTLRKGDILSCRITNGNSYSFVSGEFTLEYDHNIFAFDSAELDSRLSGEGALYSINSSVLGQVRIAYANSNPVDNYDLFTVKLKVIADADTSTTIKTQASNVYRPDLSAYLPGSSSATVWLEKEPAVTDYPNAFFQTEELETGRQNKSVFCLEAGVGVAAADFTLTYDPSVLRCVSVVMAEGVADHGGMLVINDNYTAGTIRFSYVNMSAYAAADLPLVVITWEPLHSPQSHYEIVSRAVGVVDEDQTPIILEYVVDSGCIFAPSVTPPTCTEDGYTSHTCSACGKTYQDSPVGALGHSHEAVVTAPTCTEEGYTTYTCHCGDSYVADRVAALGHSAGEAVTENETAATCTVDGRYDTVVYCSVCHKELSRVTTVVPSTGHNYVDGKCGCGAEIVVIGQNISYTVSDQIITVSCDKPCKVGYWDAGAQTYIPITAVANNDGSYGFTAPKSVMKVLIVIKGDTNHDGRISAPDIARLNAHLQEKTVLTAEELFAADVTGDGHWDETDIRFLSDAILGIRPIHW